MNHNTSYRMVNYSPSGFFLLYIKFKFMLHFPQIVFDFSDI